MRGVSYSRGVRLASERCCSLREAGSTRGGHVDQPETGENIYA